ncbi:MAG: phosphatase PAP2 family protein [Clostridia bacterium]|nr:phosphatase PAP2 family protein [Clostridia bacterium]
MEVIYRIDYAVLNWIQNNIACAPFDAFFRLITHLGDGGVFCLLLTAVMLCFRKTRKMGFVMAVSILIGTLTCNVILKNAVARVRPYDNYPYDPLRTGDMISKLIKLPKDWSFPSGHSTVAVETAVSVFFFRKKWGVFAIAVALIVAFSRLYLYVHYFTDVLCGIAIGVLSAVAAYYIVKYAEKKIGSAIEKRREEKSAGQKA